jgi:HK97 gp10 family phage protein
MPSRIVLVPNAEGRVDTRPLLNHLANDVADVMRTLAPVDEGDMVSTIRPHKATLSRVKIVVGGIRGKVTGKPVNYARFVEQGTSKASAQPFMRPALWRYRSGR